MAINSQSRSVLLLVTCIVGLGIAYMVWHWEVERIEVPPGKFLIRIHKWGQNLAEGEIIAPDETYKGVMLDVWAEGRHFLNPLIWDHEIEDMIEVPPGQCLVLTRKFGKPIPAERMEEGDVLARDNPSNPLEGERGIVKDVLSPGSYRINKYAYSWEPKPAVEIKINQVGVRTLKVGKDPRKLPVDPKRGHYVVPDGYRGVQQTAVKSGTYYINEYVETIIPVEVRSHRVELSDISFPSRDGFILKPRVVVEYAVQPEMAPEMLVRLTDAGAMHQQDSTIEEQQNNEVLQKVILPHIRGYARIEGSNFDARDFILSGPADDALRGTPAAPDALPPEGLQPEDPAAPVEEATEPAEPAALAAKAPNAREAMQRALLAKVKPKCEELGVEIRAVTMADLLPPTELSEQIAQRELARVEREKNQALVRQHKAQQELASKIGLKQQAKEKVAAETRLIQEKTRADQLKEVEESRLTQELENAKVDLEAARDLAAATLVQGEADAKVISLKNEAEVAGLRTAIEGFSSIEHFAQFHILEKLGPALTEIFASDDGDFARLIGDYISRPEAMPYDERPSATAAAPAVESVEPTTQE